MDTRTATTPRTSQGRPRDSDDGGIEDLVSQQLQSELDLEGRYYECSDIEEFFDYVASKLPPSRTSPGREPLHGAEVQRCVTAVCQERRQALLARKFLPYRDGNRESLDRAIDCWLEIEGRRSLQEAVSALTSSYRLAFGPEESTAEFLLSATCRSRTCKNQEHIVHKTSEIGKANSVVSMRLIQRIEALEPRPHGGGPSFGQFQARHGQQGPENNTQRIANPNTKAVDSSAFALKPNATRDPDEPSSRVASPNEPGSACPPTPCADPFVSMPNRVLGQQEVTTRKQRGEGAPRMLQARGGKDFDRSTPKKTSTGTQTTSEKSTSSTQTYGRSWDQKSHTPGNADTRNVDALDSDTEEAFLSPSARGSGTQPSPVPPIRRRATYHQHDDKTSARVGGPAVKTILFPAAHKKNLRKSNNNKRAASQKGWGDSSAHSSPSDVSVRGLRSNATAYPLPSSRSRTRATTDRSISPPKMMMPKDRYPSSRWSPGSAESKSSPHQQHRTTTGYAVESARDADHRPAPCTPTNIKIPRGNALLTAEHGSRGRRRNQAPAQQPLLTPCSDRKRKLRHVLDDDADDIVDLTISSDECKKSRSRRKELRNSGSTSFATAATFSLEQRLANLEKLVGLQDKNEI
ncbi:hypothetical protein SLS62_005540 [Diatrype stigma]|uniref:Uncharacterized protein n=1 Tax=Diatrype stigma TaxID=117547 RepID=A0AAN9USM2_9PEZI